MDLNIGCAFWFASRAQGVVREYTATDVEVALAAQNELGRPLLRLGEDGVVRGVGVPRGGGLEGEGERLEGGEGPIPSRRERKKKGWQAGCWPIFFFFVFSQSVAESRLSLDTLSQLKHGMAFHRILRVKSV